VHTNLVPFFRKRNYQHPLPADPERFLALVELLYTTGLRRGDGCQFQADFIDPHDFHYQAVQTQTGIEVSVGIPEALAAKLRSLAPLPWRGADPNYPNAGRYIFWDGTGDADDEVFKKYMDNVIGRPLRELGNSLNIPGLRPHRLRDSFAVNSLLSGLTMDEVSRLLGHKSVKTTERYYCPKVLSRVRLLLDRQKALRRPFLIAS
ncbi:MAG: site-specific integrase, partial [Bryobacteraceae bacterium]